MVDAPRKRRWPWILGIGLLVLGVAGLWVNYQLEPHRLARTVLDAVGESQGLEISFDGEPSYALKPEPRLVLPRIVARKPGAADPLLTADRAEVSLPWNTIRGDGPVVITRIELDAPVLDLAALADWRASRPETPFELPTLTRGAHISNGHVVGDGWDIEVLDLDLAELRPGQPLRLDTKGRLVRDDLRLDFDADLAIQRASLDSAFELKSSGHVRQDELESPWSLSTTGDFDFSGNKDSSRQSAKDAGRLDLTRLVFEGESPLPSIEASGSARFGETTQFGLQGSMPEWPEGWPVLPEPEASTTPPTEFSLAYDGANDLSDPLSLKLSRGETRADAALVIVELQTWLANDNRSPLPPLRGTFSAPTLVIEGFTLENVQAELVPSEPTEPAQASEE